jgi:hypothetical protein
MTPAATQPSRNGRATGGQDGASRNYAGRPGVELSSSGRRPGVRRSGHRRRWPLIDPIRNPRFLHLGDFTMSLTTTAIRFVALCRQGKNFDVMRAMYSPDIVSIESDGKETFGQGPVIKKSEDWVADKTFHGETVAGPFFNGANPDRFAVYFTLDITPKATGKRITREEVAVYTVTNDKITREQFFYDGEH